MIGIHDLGGFDNLGPVHPEDGATFHEDWEKLTFGLQMLGAAVGDWTADEYRHYIELMPPADYMNASYYIHWLVALEELYTSRGLVSREELAKRQEEIRSGAELPPPAPIDPEVPARLIAAMKQAAFHGGGVRKRDQERSFAVGDRVRAKTRAIPGHTRLQRYAFGKPGVIVSYNGVYALPETAAKRDVETVTEPVYGVRFEGTDLWGEGAEPGTSVTLDLWESYMEHDDTTQKGTH